jgi:hypothetical protein
MKDKDRSLYGNSRDIEEENNDFAFAITPNCFRNIEAIQGVDPASVNAGDLIANIGNNRHMYYVLTSARKTAVGGTGVVFDHMGGSNFVIKQDPYGVDMFAISDPSVSGMSTYWMFAAEPGSYGDLDPVLIATPLPSAPTYGATFRGAINENFMIFLSLYIPLNEPTGPLATVGFDSGGYTHTTGRVGAVAGYVSDQGSATQFGIQSADGTWDGSYAAFPAFYPSATYGRVTFTCVVNGNSSVEALRSIGKDSPPTAAFSPGVPSSVTWTGIPATQPMKLNFGDGCSTDLGIYCMGIRNYSAAISTAEHERVHKAISHTGVLPYWWR